MALKKSGLQELGSKIKNFKKDGGTSIKMDFEGLILISPIENDLNKNYTAICKD